MPDESQPIVLSPRARPILSVLAGALAAVFVVLSDEGSVTAIVASVGFAIGFWLLLPLIVGVAIWLQRMLTSSRGER